MSIHDRPYYSEDEKPRMGLHFPRPGKVLIGLMVFYGLSYLLFTHPRTADAAQLVGVGLHAPGSGAFEFWQVATYGLFFPPVGLLTVVMHLFSLYFVGVHVERKISANRLLGVFVAAIVAGGVVCAGFLYAAPAPRPVFGPEAGWYAIVMLFGCLYATDTFWVLRGWAVALVFTGLAVVYAASARDWPRLVLIAAGMATAFLYHAGRPALERHLERKRAEKLRQEAEEKAHLQEDVDGILDKIHREGMNALTPAEKAKLLRASREFQNEKQK